MTTTESTRKTKDIESTHGNAATEKRRRNFNGALTQRNNGQRERNGRTTSAATRERRNTKGDPHGKDETATGRFAALSRCTKPIGKCDVGGTRGPREIAIEQEKAKQETLTIATTKQKDSQTNRTLQLDNEKQIMVQTKFENL